MAATVSAAGFESILSEAFAAGAAAGAAIVPTPMTLSGHGQTYYVSEGPCGFGWVQFKGTSAFAKWAKKAGHARSAYPTGLSIWSKLMTQSLARNEAWAYAVAEVLRKHGIEAHSHSRID